MSPQDHIEVIKNDDGTHTVVGGELNDDRNIYVVDENNCRTGEVLGQMKNEYDFFEYKSDGFGDVLIGATIGKGLPDNSKYASEYLNNLKTQTSERLDNDKGMLNRLNTLAVLSVNDGPLDIKTKLGARDGYEYSQGVFTTGRELGNMLFGANLRSVYDKMDRNNPSLFSPMDFYKFTMKSAIGKYNQFKNGRGYNSFPAYGEDLGSGLGIYKGFFKGLWNFWKKYYSQY